MRSTTTVLLAAVFAIASTALAEEAPINRTLFADEVIVVTGDLRESALANAATSVSVVSEQVIRARGATHLDELLNVAPNVNFSGGSSRARYFQIRGIGERGQFAEPLNPSVGVIVDDVDLSGAATAASLFDMRQVEIFRGPQGSRYGANAHAGLIVLRSNAPTDDFRARGTASAGNYGTYTLGGVVSGPVTDSVRARLAVQGHQSDGFVDNRFLDSEDTERRDETTLRLRMDWDLSDSVQAEFSLSRVEIDNGYDAFSFENGRDTRSDEPGEDVQKSTFASMRLTWTTDAGFDAQVIGAFSDSRIAYSYDEDWSFVGFDPFEYSSTDRYLRNRDTRSLELRLTSNESSTLLGGDAQWVLGYYNHEREVDLTRIYTFLGAPFASTYETGRDSIYGQLRISLGDDLAVTLGGRNEWREASYDDNNGVAFDPDESLWGGRLGVEWQMDDDRMLWATISRGYKAGGFNTDGTLPANRREYDSETVLNYEVGLNAAWLNGTLLTRTSIFLMDREDQQVGTSATIVRPGGSTEFIDFVDNAAQGTNYGAEFEADWQVSEAVRLTGSLGLLSTELEDFVNSAGQNLDGRDQAHAPNWQFHLAADWNLTDQFFLRLETEGRDAFYWSDSHAERAQSYALVHARAGWRGERISVALWARNLFDETYAVRGFGGFGNDPRDLYTPNEYLQLGAPRTIGVTVNASLRGLQ